MAKDIFERLDDWAVLGSIPKLIFDGYFYVMKVDESHAYAVRLVPDEDAICPEGVFQIFKYCTKKVLKKGDVLAFDIEEIPCLKIEKWKEVDTLALEDYFEDWLENHAKAREPLLLTKKYHEVKNKPK